MERVNYAWKKLRVLIAETLANSLCYGVAIQTDRPGRRLGGERHGGGGERNEVVIPKRKHLDVQSWQVPSVDEIENLCLLQLVELAPCLPRSVGPLPPTLSLQKFIGTSIYFITMHLQCSQRRHIILVIIGTVIWLEILVSLYPFSVYEFSILQ